MSRVCTASFFMWRRSLPAALAYEQRPFVETEAATGSCLLLRPATCVTGVWLRVFYTVSPIC